MNDQDTSYPLTQTLVDAIARERSDMPERLSPGPSREMLDLVWEAAQGHADWKPFVAERIPLRALAAADGPDQVDAPARIPQDVDEERSQWTVTREDRIGDDLQKILRFRAHPDHTAAFSGRRIEIQVGRDVFDLGVIDSSGTASRLIPMGVDLRQPIELRIGELE